MSNSTIILCCYYKENEFVPLNNIYLPIQCGKKNTGIDLGMLSDDTNDNISSRNRYWSEITGLYWFWKNYDYSNKEYIGLCSYRRFFNFKTGLMRPLTEIFPKSSFKSIDKIRIPNIRKVLDKYDLIAPKKYHYAYNMWNVFRMNYYTEDFLVLKDVIHLLYPEYDDAFVRYTRFCNKGYGHNMFIMKRFMFDDYCNWVFNILFEIEKRIDPTGYPVDKIRIFGYMHEFLFSLYIYKNKLKTYESQLTWITDERTNFNFNKITYKIAANCSFFFNKPRN